MSRTWAGANRAGARLATVAAIGIVGAALTAGFIVASSEPNAPIVASATPVPATPTATVEPRADVLTAILLSDAWATRTPEYQELLCVEWADRRSNVMAKVAGNALELSELIDIPTAVDFFDYACAEIAADDELGAPVSMDEHGNLR